MRLVTLRYIGHVTTDELVRGKEKLQLLIDELSPGFRLLQDLTDLEKMDVDCADALGALMEVTDRSGVGLVVRVIPDPSKDIGFNILTIFHAPSHPTIVTCRSLTEAEPHFADDQTGEGAGI